MPAGPSIPTLWPWWPGKAALTLSPLSPAAVPISSQQSNKVSCHPLPYQPSSISQGTTFLGKGNCNLSSFVKKAEGSSGLQAGPRELMPAECSHAAAVLDLCVLLSTPGMPRGELGLLSIPHGDLKFREPSLITQNVCLDLLEEVPSPAAGHPLLMRSCRPPSALLEPRGKLCPLHFSTAGRHSWGRGRRGPSEPG